MVMIVAVAVIMGDLDSGGPVMRMIMSVLMVVVMAVVVVVVVIMTMLVIMVAIVAMTVVVIVLMGRAGPAGRSEQDDRPQSDNHQENNPCKKDVELAIRRQHEVQDILLVQEDAHDADHAADADRRQLCHVKGSPVLFVRVRHD